MNVEIHIRDFVIKRLHIDWREPEGHFKEFSVDTALTNFDYTVGKHMKDPTLYKMTFQATFEQKSGEKQLGFNIDVRIAGVFQVNKNTPDDKAGIVIRHNGLSILYGILRGIIGVATSVYPSGKFVLPTIDVPEIVGIVEARKMKAAKGKIIKASVLPPQSSAQSLAASPS